MGQPQGIIENTIRESRAASDAKVQTIPAAVGGHGAGGFIEMVERQSAGVRRECRRTILRIAIHRDATRPEQGNHRPRSGGAFQTELVVTQVSIGQTGEASEGGDILEVIIPKSNPSQIRQRGQRADIGNAIARKGEDFEIGLTGEGSEIAQADGVDVQFPQAGQAVDEADICEWISG